MFWVPTVAHADTLPNPKALISQYAAEYGVSSTTMYKTLECESAGFQNIQSMIPHKGQPNGREDSWGLVQVYLPAKNKDFEGKVITKEQALDPDFAIKWMAWQFSIGGARKWSCWRGLALVDRKNTVLD